VSKVGITGYLGLGLLVPILLRKGWRNKGVIKRFMKFELWNKINSSETILYVYGFIAERRTNRNSLSASHLYYNKVSIFITDIPLSYR
jgi:hypothetical protein